VVGFAVARTAFISSFMSSTVTTTSVLFMLV
jgi:hypothetical protein